MIRLIGRFLCNLGFHLPGALETYDGGLHWRIVCHRPGCGCDYHDDFEQELC